MGIMNQRRVVLQVVAMAALLAISPGWGGAQDSPVAPTPTPRRNQPIRSVTDDDGPSPFPDTSKQKRNDERQRRLVNDADRLLALANQLKAEVAASGTDSMTPQMLRQMDEIEKLARSVKDKMRN